jgi:hypothetical protein
VRNTGEIFKLIENIKEIPENINFYISIYSNTNIRIRNIEFLEKYEISIKSAGRKIISSIKNSARSQSPNKRRKLIGS